MTRWPSRWIRAVALLAATAAAVTACATGTARAPSTPAADPVVPTSTPTPTLADRATHLVDQMTLRDRLASLLILHPPGSDPTAVAQFVAVNRPGGVILMGDNVGPAIVDVAALTAAVQRTDLPMLLAIDQEGGVVTRLPGDVFPAGEALAVAPVADTTAAFTERAELVRAAGLNLNFGVVADVPRDASSFIYDRALGADPGSASDRVAAAVSAEAAVGVLSTLKHFPGHGAAPGDSHHSVPTTDLPFAAWSASDALPFRAGIDAGAEVVMMGHLVFSAVDSAPASLSPAWHSILRDDLGFDGLIVSDDLGMLENSGDPAYADRITNAITALNAGTTMLVIVADGPTPVPTPVLLDGLVAAVQDGRLSASVVDAAAIRATAARLDLIPD